MISVTPPPAAPSKASSSTTASASSDAASSGFDSILAEETLAATSEGLDTTLAGAGLEGLFDDESSTELDDTDDTEVEDSLAFLVDLLNVAAVPIQPQPTQADAGDSADGIDDVLSGGSNADGTGADAGLLATQPPATDADKAGRLVDAALTAASGTVDTTQPDTKQADATAANVVRAAELMTHGPRHVAVAARDGILTHARDPQWAEEFNTRVALMVRGNESSASLQMTPADLGPLDVNVTVRDSNATIHFGAAQAETRALIEASIPKLREMLAAQGFNLMDASVSQGFARQSRHDAPVRSAITGATEVEAPATTRMTVNGLLDLYA